MRFLRQCAPLAPPRPLPDASPVTDHPSPPVTDGEALIERLRAAAELLDSVAADRAAFEALPVEEQKRLKAAVNRFHNPNPIDHRKRRREARRAAVPSPRRWAPAGPR